MNKLKALDALYTNRYLCQDKEIDLFVEDLEELNGRVVLEDLPKLLDALEDQANRTEMMDELVNLIESIESDIEDFVELFISNINICILDGKEWCKTLFVHMLNSDEHLKAICNCIVEDKVDTEDLIELIDDMMDNYISHKKHLNFIKSLIYGEELDIDIFFVELYPKKINVSKQEVLNFVQKNRGTSNNVDSLYWEYISCLTKEKELTDVTILLCAMEEDNYNHNLRLGYSLREYLETFGPERYVEALLNAFNDDRVELFRTTKTILLEVIEKNDTYQFLPKYIKTISDKSKLLKAFESIKSNSSFTKEKQNEIMDCFIYTRLEDDEVIILIEELKELYNNLDRNSKSYFADSNKIMNKESQIRKMVEKEVDAKYIQRLLTEIKEKHKKQPVVIPTLNNSDEVIPENFIVLLKQLSELQTQMKSIDFTNPNESTESMNIGMKIGQINMKLSNIIMQVSMTNPTDPRINKMNEEMIKVMTS